MTALGTIPNLSDHLVLDGLESAPLVVANQQRTLTGVSVVQVAINQGGRVLTLNGQNHFTLAQVAAIKALEGTGQAVTLIHHRGTFIVLIVKAEFTPARDLANPTDEDWYSGEITMIEV